MRRSAISIPANIADGYRRGHRKEYVQFLRIAQGSCGELETFHSISKALGFIKEKEFEELDNAQDEISRFLQALISSLSMKKALNSHVVVFSSHPLSLYPTP